MTETSKRPLITRPSDRFPPCVSGARLPLGSLVCSPKITAQSVVFNNRRSFSPCKSFIYAPETVEEKKTGMNSPRHRRFLRSRSWPASIGSLLRNGSRKCCQSEVKYVMWFKTRRVCRECKARHVPGTFEMIAKDLSEGGEVERESDREILSRRRQELPQR